MDFGWLVVLKRANSPVADDFTPEIRLRKVHKTQLLGVRKTAVLEGLFPAEFRITRCRLRNKDIIQAITPQNHIRTHCRWSQGC